MKTTSENAQRISELNEQKKMLIRSNEVLLNQISKIDLELKISQMQDDVDKINEYTDVLNSMFVDPAILRHTDRFENRIYELMNDIDKVMMCLQDDIEELKNDLNDINNENTIEEN